ncbi:MAG: hypothetical protein ACYCTB_04910 [bacterium]
MIKKRGLINFPHKSYNLNKTSLQRKKNQTPFSSFFFDPFSFLLNIKDIIKELKILCGGSFF